VHFFLITARIVKIAVSTFNISRPVNKYVLFAKEYFNNLCCLGLHFQKQDGFGTLIFYLPQSTEIRSLNVIFSKPV